MCWCVVCACVCCVYHNTKMLRPYLKSVSAAFTEVMRHCTSVLDALLRVSSVIEYHMQGQLVNLSMAGSRRCGVWVGQGALLLSYPPCLGWSSLASWRSTRLTLSMPARKWRRKKRWARRSLGYSVHNRHGFVMPHLASSDLSGLGFWPRSRPRAFH